MILKKLTMLSYSFNFNISNLLVASCEMCSTLLPASFILMEHRAYLHHFFHLAKGLPDLIVKSPIYELLKVTLMLVENDQNNVWFA
jgi:hypothetical protein